VGQARQDFLYSFKSLVQNLAAVPVPGRGHDGSSGGLTGYGRTGRQAGGLRLSIRSRVCARPVCRLWDSLSVIQLGALDWLRTDAMCGLMCGWRRPQPTRGLHSRLTALTAGRCLCTPGLGRRRYMVM